MRQEERWVRLHNLAVSRHENFVVNGVCVHNCRHSLSFVSWPELRARRLVLPDGTVRRARLPAGAHADAGFRHTGRPDRAIYGGLA